MLRAYCPPTAGWFYWEEKAECKPPWRQQGRQKAQEPLLGYESSYWEMKAQEPLLGSLPSSLAT